MISEHDLARRFGSFWHELLPFSDLFIRDMNRAFVEDYSDRWIRGLVGPSHTAAVNEAGFALFRNEVDGVERPVSLFDHDPFMRQLGMIEAVRIAGRLKDYFDQSGLARPQFYPAFAGCGFVGACKGDILAGRLLVEVKAGTRPFRAEHVRQVLVYSALEHAAGSHRFDEVCLLNPRGGMDFRMSLVELVQRLTGRHVDSVLEQVVQFVSERGNSI